MLSHSSGEVVPENLDVGKILGPSHPLLPCEKTRWTNERDTFDDVLRTFQVAQVRTLIGALIMGVLRNGLNLLGVSSYLQQLVIGSVIIIAVLVDTLLKYRRV